MRFVFVLSHPSDKDKDVAKVHPTNEDLFAGTPRWGTQVCSVRSWLAV
jgi:hypothetical protein